MVSNLRNIDKQVFNTEHNGQPVFDVFLLLWYYNSMRLFESYEEDGITPAYFRTAREHEAVFRGVLKHIKSVFAFMPREFDVEAPIDDLLEECSPRAAYGRFAVGDFLVGSRENSKLMIFAGDLSASEALVSFGSFATLSGAGAIYKYEVMEGDTPVFQKTVMQMMS